MLDKTIDADKEILLQLLELAEEAGFTYKDISEFVDGDGRDLMESCGSKDRLEI